MRINGDVALLKGIMKAHAGSREKDAATSWQSPDRMHFILHRYTAGFETPCEKADLEGDELARKHRRKAAACRAKLMLEQGR